MRRGWWKAAAAIAGLPLLAACLGNNGGTYDEAPRGQPPARTAASGKAVQAEGVVTLKLFTALSDRANGAGKVEQELIDAYMAANPGVKIEVEALQDEPYKSKIKVYAATNDLPDIIQTWGQASFIKPLIDNELLMPLDLGDYVAAGFMPGAVDGFSQDGNAYGLPRSTDYFLMYYNRKMFADNGVPIPKTTDELKTTVKKFRAKGINPIAVNGMDLWSFPIWFEYVHQRLTGDFSLMDRALRREMPFNADSFLAAAREMQQLAEMGAFADGYLTADYGTARNLFGQGQAAMYLLGSWEIGLATDAAFPDAFRENVGAMAYPASAQATSTGTAVWYGGGYSIARHTRHPEEAEAFLRYFFQPEHWAKRLWEKGAGIPASRFALTGKETALQKQLLAILEKTTSRSGTPILDEGTPEWKETIMDLHGKLLEGVITPEAFVEGLDEAASRD
ncbi:extracellular solute-binding protein [Paenibacillus aurantiacus]|uniref:Extracellular solute-binding protein n=1 Tax=Paenibacillus aurantiacus TaxID=1936118 RepID=A0ABV5KMD8_9BACL